MNTWAAYAASYVKKCIPTTFWNACAREIWIDRQICTSHDWWDFKGSSMDAWWCYVIAPDGQRHDFSLLSFWWGLPPNPTPLSLVRYGIQGQPKRRPESWRGFADICGIFCGGIPTKKYSNFNGIWSSTTRCLGDSMDSVSRQTPLTTKLLARDKRWNFDLSWSILDSWRNKMVLIVLINGPCFLAESRKSTFSLSVASATGHQFTID